MQQKCSISLHIQVLPETWQTGMDLIDLTRILGILIDNTIRNSVTPRTIQQGIHAGISTKGEGRGKGLSTVRELLSPYHNATLNSCLQGDIFIQSLTLSWQDPLS